MVRVITGLGVKTGSVRIKSEGSVYGNTEISFKRGGSMLVRLRETANIWICGQNCARGQSASLTYRKLWRLGSAYVKLISGNRLDHRIPIIDGNGYICILHGIDDLERLAQLREEAIAERALFRLGLDDESMPDHELFDNPFRILTQPDRPWRPTLHKGGDIAIVLHLFYSELWPEFELFLNQMQRPFDLWITHCGLEDQTQKQIPVAFPQAKIIAVENRGRDIWPLSLY